MCITVGSKMKRSVALLIALFVSLLGFVGIQAATPSSASASPSVVTQIATPRSASVVKQMRSAADCDPNNYNTTFCAYYNSTWTPPYNAILSVAGMPRNQCIQVSSGALEHSYTDETGAVIRLYGSHLCDGALRGTANPFSSGAVPSGYTYAVRLAVN
jgi:hypothetical protein